MNFTIGPFLFDWSALEFGFGCTVCLILAWRLLAGYVERAPNRITHPDPVEFDSHEHAMQSQAAARADVKRQIELHRIVRIGDRRL